MGTGSGGGSAERTTDPCDLASDGTFDDMSAEDWPTAKEQAMGQRESKPTTERAGTRSHVHLSATMQRFIVGGGVTIVVACGSVGTAVAFVRGAQLSWVHGAANRRVTRNIAR